MFRDDFPEGVAKLRPEELAGTSQVNKERRRAFQTEGKAYAKSWKDRRELGALGKLNSLAVRAWVWGVLSLCGTIND